MSYSVSNNSCNYVYDKYCFHPTDKPEFLTVAYVTFTSYCINLRYTWGHSSFIFLINCLIPYCLFSRKFRISLWAPPFPFPKSLPTQWKRGSLCLLHWSREKTGSAIASFGDRVFLLKASSRDCQTERVHWWYTSLFRQPQGMKRGWAHSSRDKPHRDCSTLGSQDYTGLFPFFTTLKTKDPELRSIFPQDLGVFSF